jgi:hypothetical protein
VNEGNFLQNPAAILITLRTHQLWRIITWLPMTTNIIRRRGDGAVHELRIFSTGNSFYGARILINDPPDLLPLI